MYFPKHWKNLIKNFIPKGIENEFSKRKFLNLIQEAKEFTKNKSFICEYFLIIYNFNF